MGEMNQAGRPKWVKAKKYCADTGETMNGLHARRRKGKWLDGIQCRIGPDGNLWVNLEEAQKWVEQGDQATLNSIQRSQRIAS